MVMCLLPYFERRYRGPLKIHYTMVHEELIYIQSIDHDGSAPILFSMLILRGRRVFLPDDSDTLPMLDDAIQSSLLLFLDTAEAFAFRKFVHALLKCIALALLGLPLLRPEGALFDRCQFASSSLGRR